MVLFVKKHGYIENDASVWKPYRFLSDTLRPRQNCHLFANDIFKSTFLDEDIWISINISPKFVPRGQINNILSLVQIMAWRRPGDKPLSEPMMESLLTHIYASLGPFTPAPPSALSNQQVPHCLHYPHMPSAIPILGVCIIIKKNRRLFSNVIYKRVVC